MCMASANVDTYTQSFTLMEIAFLVLLCRSSALLCADLGIWPDSFTHKPGP